MWMKMFSTERFTVVVSLFLIFWTHLSHARGQLMLTPILDRGDIFLARKSSRVHGLGYTESIIPRSYSGFITVDRQLRNHLFFWLFPSTWDFDAPLLVWLNGGPTVSSMLGLLFENGPLKVVTSDSGESRIDKRDDSWTEVFSVLYIDTLVGSGYSYTDSGRDGWRLTQDGYTKDLYSFMEQFYYMFPEYLSRELYLGGQSYAGKYVPALAHFIDTERNAGRTKIPLKGIYLGGPYFDPATQDQVTADYFYNIGAISHQQMINWKKDASKIYTQFQRGELQQTKTWEFLSTLFPDIGLPTHDNWVTGEKVGYREVQRVMTSDSFRRALHVGDLDFKVYNLDVVGSFNLDYLVSTKGKLAHIMDNYKVLIYSGNFDLNVSPAMVEEALLATPWSLQKQYERANRTVWRSREGEVKGFYSQIGDFCRVIVQGAGHQTPHDKPERTLDMMIQFVYHGCIQDSL